MTDVDRDFQLQRVDLPNLCIDAGERLGMVIVQPEYEVIPEGIVPFRISEAYRNAQMGLIEKAFQIRAAESQERNVPIPFVLFPEAAIPVSNPDGLDFLRQQIEQVQGDVIFIGGLEGLSPQEAGDIADKFTPAARPAFAAGAFVNICVIAVKTANGQLSWYFQAKLRPSPLEQPRNMAWGKYVLYFVAPRVAFLCQICFDHIAGRGGDLFNTILCRQLIESTRPGGAILDFVFVPQCNKKPDHESVKHNTNLLLNYPDRALKNEMTAVVVINKASSIQEPFEYGRSGFHYRAGRWQIPTSDIGPKGYELYDLGNVTSAVFRKRTNAIHVSTLVPSSHNIGNSGNPRQPLESPRSYLIMEGCDPALCSCLPGTPRAVGTFVECDCLPCKLRDSLLRCLPNIDTKRRWAGLKTNLSVLLASHYNQIRQKLLVLNCKRTMDLLDLLFLHREGGKRNPDTWIDTVEVDAVRELASAMSVLCELGQIDFDKEVWWTGVLGNAISIAVLDGNHALNCRDLAVMYFQKYEDYPCEMRSRPLLIVALRATGRVDPIVEEFQPRYSEARTRGPFGPSPYEPARVRTFLCRDDLFQEARRAPVLGNYLARKTRRINA